MNHGSPLDQDDDADGDIVELDAAGFTDADLASAAPTTSRPGSSASGP